MPIIVVGNKCDMKNDRAVSKEEGQSLADEFNASFLEVSAKDNFRIKEAFDTLARKVMTKNPIAIGAEEDAQYATGVFGGRESIP